MAYLGWRASRGERHLDQIRELINACINPLVNRISLLEQHNIDTIQRNSDATDIAIGKAIQPIESRMAILETKVDVFWKQIAMDAAKILHQPDPRRARVDALLEAFMEDALSPQEELELRKILLKIRNWEPGQELEFPISDGEQAVAALLLRTMNYAITPRHTGAAHYHGDLNE